MEIAGYGHHWIHHILHTLGHDYNHNLYSVLVHCNLELLELVHNHQPIEFSQSFEEVKKINNVGKEMLRNIHLNIF